MNETQSTHRRGKKRWLSLDRSFLVRLFGYRGALIHGDPMVLDRWRFAKRHLPITRNGEQVFDAGCGAGAFTIGAAKRGYTAVGLSWDQDNQRLAQQRAVITGASDATFPIGDLRELDVFEQFVGRFDFVLSLENIEHILDDRKLIKNLAACLKPGGWLVMSAPNHRYHALEPMDQGPFVPIENGWHVRRGYTPAMFAELADIAGLSVEEVSSCSGYLSQKITAFMRKFGFVGWVLSIPLRVLPPVFDRAIERITGYPDYSICMVAYKPRYG